MRRLPPAVAAVAALAAALLLPAPTSARPPRPTRVIIIPDLPAPTDYPDEGAVILHSGTVTFSLNLGGSVTHDLDGTTRVFTASVNAAETLRLAPGGGTRTWSYRGRDETVLTAPGQKDRRTVVALRGSGTGPLAELRPGQGALGPFILSRKLNLLCGNLTRGNDTPGQWTIEGLEGTISFDGRPAPFEGVFTARIPNAGLAGGELSRALTEAERQGQDPCGGPLTAGGFFEAPWTDGSCSGSLTVPVRGSVPVQGSYTVDTPQAADWLTPPAQTAAMKLITVPGSLTVSWNLGTAPPKNAMTIAPASPDQYDTWLPQPTSEQKTESPLGVVVELRSELPGLPPPSARVDFYLRDVSRHEGECGNAPRNRSLKYDLRFSAIQPKGVVVDTSDPTHAWTTEPVSKATVFVQAEDGGAHGVLQAEAKDLGLLAKDERTGRLALSVPKDDNDNDIADFWEEQAGIFGENRPPTWDEEEVAGQTGKGDGLTLYAEYRGLRVLDGVTATYRRLDPKKKELFVVDPSRIFDEALWERASGITAVRLDESLVQGGAPLDPASRLVDFKGDGRTYAVRVESVAGAREKVQYQEQPADAYDTLGYTDQQGNSPRTALVLRVFPDRIRATLFRLATSVARGLKDPSSPDGRALAAAGLPPWLAQRALDQLSDPAAVERLASEMLTLCTIHEMGHACGLPGHSRNGGPETTQGDPACPMKYMNQVDERNLVILQVLFGSGKPLTLQYDRFCETDFRCRAALNLKD